MNTIASLLVAASAAIILLFGLIHLLYTFSGPKAARLANLYQRKQ